MNPQAMSTLLTKHPRRSLLQVAAAAATFLVASLQPSRVGASHLSADLGAVAPEFEGTWLETVTFHGENLPPQVQAPFPTLITFARGGGLITIAGNTAPTRGNLSFGTWVKTGPKQFAFTFLGMFYDAEGVLENYVKGRETLRFGADRDAYDGVATVQLLDPKFAVLGELEATTHATRIRAQ